MSARYYNYILNHSASGLAAALTDRHRGVDITEHDVPYYFEAGTTGPFGVTDWFAVSAESISGEDELELMFLIDLGLAMQVGDTDTYIVNPLAVKLFYGDTGLFNEDLPDDKKDAAEDAWYEFMRGTVLPGYARMYEAMSAGLSPAIAEHGTIWEKTNAIKDALALLNGRI